MANILDILAQNYTQGGRFNPFALARGFTGAGRADIDQQRELMRAQQEAGIGQANVQTAGAAGTLQARKDMRAQGGFDQGAGIFVDSPETLALARDMLAQRQAGQNLQLGALDIPYNTARNRMAEMGLQDATSFQNYLREGGVTSPQQFALERQAALDQSAMAGQAAQTAALQGGERRAAGEYAAREPLLADSARLSLEDQRSQIAGRNLQGFSSLLGQSAVADSFVPGTMERAMRAGAGVNPVAGVFQQSVPQARGNPATQIDNFIRRGGSAPAGQTPSPARPASNAGAQAPNYNFRKPATEPAPEARPLSLQPMQTPSGQERAMQIRQQLRDLYDQYVKAVAQFEGPQGAAVKATQGWSNLPEVRAMLEQLKQLEGGQR